MKSEAERVCFEWIEEELVEKMNSDTVFNHIE